VSGRVSWCGYVSVLHALMTAGSLRSDEIAERLNRSIWGVRPLMAGLHTLKVVHIAGWQSPKPRVIALPLWRYGPGKDAARPVNALNGKPNKRKLFALDDIESRPRLAAFGLLFHALLEGATVSELTELLGTQASHNIERMLTHGHKLGVFHISAWEQPRSSGGGKLARVWKCGLAADAKRPRPMPASVKLARWRDARRAKTNQLRALHALAGVANNQLFKQRA
jgi:hypothetical protein